MNQFPAGDFDADQDPANRRERPRLPLIFRVTCVIYSDPNPDVWITDVSQSGCRLFAHAGMFREGESLVVVRPDGERHRGKVAWVSGERAGVRFDAALPHLALKQLLASSQMGDRALSELEPLIDQFGRKLAPLIRLSRL